jgi:hypothetical protein
MKSIALVILGRLFLLPGATPSEDREADVRTMIGDLIRRSMMDLLGQPTTPRKTGTTSVLTEVAIAVAKQRLRTCADCIKLPEGDNGYH